MSAEERRRSSRRVAALAADIHDGDFDLRADAPDGDGAGARGRPLYCGPAGAVGHALRDRDRLRRHRRRHPGDGRAVAQQWVARRRRRRPPRAGSPPAGNAEAVPLELLALGHDRTGDELTVRGVIRNPSSGVAGDRLTAVVFLFNRDGGFLTSGRATLWNRAGARAGRRIALRRQTVPLGGGCRPCASASGPTTASCRTSIGASRRSRER